MDRKFFGCWIALVLLLALACRLAYILYTGFAEEDGYITFRYAHMLASGQGFVFNPGEHVYGTTTPLLALLLAGWMVLAPVDPLPGARVLGIAAASGTILCTIFALRRLRFSNAAQVMVGLTLALSTRLWAHDTGGMETPLVLFFMAASWLALVYHHSRWAGFLAGLLLWTRIDAIVWVAVLAGIAWFGKRREATGFILTAGLTYLPWLVFATFYFGSPIPHTILAKQAAYADYNTAPLTDHLRVVLGYLSPFAISQEKRSLTLELVALTLGLAGWQTWRSRNQSAFLALVVFVLLELTRLTLTRATFFNRYFVPTLWAVLVLAAAALGELWNPRQLSARNACLWSAIWLATSVTLAIGILGENSRRLSQIGDLMDDYLLLALSIAMALFFWIVLTYFQPRGMPAITESGRHKSFVLDRLFQPALLVVLGLTLAAGTQNIPDLLNVARNSQFYRNQLSLKAIGLWLKQNSPPGASVLLEPIGYIGYYSERVIRDEVGLVTPAVTILKQQGRNDNYSYLQDMQPDYVIQHCDEIDSWLQRDTPASNPLRSFYHFEIKFNPLNFDTRLDYAPHNELIVQSRMACYEIWARNR